MTGTVTKALTASAIALFVALGSGCANTQQIDELRAAVEKAQSTADSAASAARSAQATASEAQRAADQANACCRANSEKIDRMFKKSMQK